MSRVFAGDDEQYFPDWGVSLKPGDPVPDGVEVADDDGRFVAPNSKEGRDAKARGQQLEKHADDETVEPVTAVEPPAEDSTAS